jgi:tRNA pseudouridine13 synthase
MLFKNRYVDFVVEENIPYSLSKEHIPTHPWLYIKLEKRNMNTMDLVKAVMKQTALPRKKIGIAWLKDKHALARQWFCFHSSDVAKIGDKKFLQTIQQITKVIDFWFSTVALNLSTQITNTFWIRLRKDPKNREKKALIQSFNDPKSKMRWISVPSGIKWTDIDKDILEQRLKKLYTDWFLNLYGEQRFGWTHANHRIAQEIIAGTKKNMDKSEIMFKLQSLSSRLFNNYCTYREKKYNRAAIEWDIVVNDAITWPVFWDDLQRADQSTESGKLEQEWKEHFEINEEMSLIYKKYGLFWLRRPIRVKPTKASHQRQWDDLLLQFTLSKGSYASVLVEELLGE